jgi:hypothetical protein
MIWSKKTVDDSNGTHTYTSIFINIHTKPNWMEPIENKANIKERQSLKARRFMVFETKRHRISSHTNDNYGNLLNHRHRHTTKAMCAFDHFQAVAWLTRHTHTYILAVDWLPAKEYFRFSVSIRMVIFFVENNWQFGFILGKFILKAKWKYEWREMNPNWTHVEVFMEKSKLYDHLSGQLSLWKFWKIA